MGCGIYKIENKINNKKYIGSSIDVEKRLKKHLIMLKGEYHDNIYLQKSFNKYGEDNFTLKIIEECNHSELVDKENYYINLHKSNISKFGYNLALVNNDRRNIFNDETKIKMSKNWLLINKNFSKFKLTNINTNLEIEFDNLFEAAKYFIDNGYTKSKNSRIRNLLSKALRGIKINNGNNGSIRKTIYKHKFEILE